MAETNLREATNEIEITGWLVDYKLEDTTTKDGKVRKTGYVTIATDKDNTNHVVVSVGVNALKNDGTENPAYKGLETFEGQVAGRTIAEVGIENAVKVACNRAKLNPYWDINNNVPRYSIQNSFFTQVKDGKNFNAKTDGSIEVYVESVRDEMIKDDFGDFEASGRVILVGWLPLYGGSIEKVELVAPEDIADALRDEVKSGDTLRLDFEVVSRRITEKKQLASGFGRVKEKISHENKQELLIYGGSNVYDEDSPEYYKKEVIEAAIAERDVRLEERKNNRNNTTSRNTPPSSNRTLPNLGLDI